MKATLRRADALFLALLPLLIGVAACGGGRATPTLQPQTPPTSPTSSTPTGLSSVPFKRSSSCTGATRAFTRAGVRVTTNVDYLNVSQGGLCLDVFGPDDNASRPAVVLLHGAVHVALVGLDGREGLTPEALQLARSGFVAVNVDWPPYPAYHIPAAVKAVDTALSYVESHSSAYHIRRGAVGLLGTSAGGLLAGYVATQHIPYLKAVVTWSGAFDRSGPVATPQRLEALFGCTSCPVISQYSAVRHATSSTPPFAMFNSTNELIPVSQPQAMAAALAAAGVPHKLVLYAGTRHATQYASQAIGPTTQWFKKYLG